jgi:N-acetylmuramoyl-L-alanine amidase
MRTTFSPPKKSATLSGSALVGTTAFFLLLGGMGILRSAQGASATPLPENPLDTLISTPSPLPHPIETETPEPLAAQPEPHVPPAQTDPVPVPAASLSPPPATPPKFARPFKIVIDPGHGGVDHGTVHDNGMVKLAEKDVTLMLARGVARELIARGFEVTLTRTDDRDLALGARTQLANRLGADIFLSIHMNSTTPGSKHGTEGFETYILNNATDASSKRLAHLENTVIWREGIKTSQQADVALILRDLRLDANLSESKRLACAVQSGVAASHGKDGNKPRGGGWRDRGVKQALFHVLLGADMPSALLEAGFLSSPRDRAVVMSPQGRKAVSEGIARAIETFRNAKGTPKAALALSRCKVH